MLQRGWLLREPLRKNLEHLLSHSAAVIVGTQFWYPHLGGVYILWYLPLLLLIVFRPRLAHLPMPIGAPAMIAANRDNRNASSGNPIRMPILG